MVEQFFAYTDRFVKFTQSDKYRLAATLTRKHFEATAELVANNNHEQLALGD